MVTARIVFSKALAVTIAVLLLCHARSLAQGKNSDYEADGEKLFSEQPPVREKTLSVLMKAQKADQGFDLKNKEDIFRRVISLGQPNYAYRACHFLAKLPEDRAVTRLAESVVDKKNQDITELVGVLAYLEIRRPQVFLAFFEKRTYLEIKDSMLMLFASSDIVCRKKEDYHRQVLKEYLNWNPDKYQRDTPNPYRQKLLDEGHAIVPMLVKIYSEGDVQLPLSIIWILGEIGSTDAFDLLLKEYLARPAERTAISLGSCLGSLSSKRLFEGTFKDESELRRLLMFIYGRKWQEVKESETKDIADHMIKRLQDIRQNCKERSCPILG